MQTIAVICAMDSEFALIQKACSHGRTEQLGRLTFHLAEYAGKQLIAAVCGIGKVNAAACAQAILARYKPDCLICSGVAGALSTKVGILDFAIANELLYHDLEERLLENYFPHQGRFHPDKRIIELAQSLCGEFGFHAVPCRIATGDLFVTDSALKARISEETKADACEMEGCAIGHVCAINETPFAVIRCISDCADDSGEMDFDSFVVEAAARSAKLTLALIERL